MIRRSITAKMSALVVIPLVALIGLWLFATGLTIGPARDLRSAETLTTQLGNPARDIVDRLQAERRLSVVRQGLRTANAPTTDIEAALTKQREITDGKIAAFLERAGRPEVGGAANGVITSRLQEFRTAISELPTGRQSIDGAKSSRAAIMHLYTGIIDAAYHLFSPLAEVNDPELGRISRTLLGLSRAREFIAQEDALISGVAAAGKMSLSDITEISGAIGAQRRLFADAAAELPAAEGTAYATMRGGQPFGQLGYMEDRLIQDGREGKPLPIDAQVWRGTIDTILTQLSEFEVQAAAPRLQRAMDVARTAYLRLSLAGVAGLGAVLLALWIGLRVARSVTRRLRRLRDVASSLADVELPDVVSRLRHGDKVDGSEAERTLEFGLDEIGEVGHAFSAVRRTAVHAAIDEAALRHGLNEVFLNVARRSQTLLHRQLTLLDRMERRSHDPQELEDLFRLDHLATRMRRHAEDLVILAGGAPGRGWRHPVPAVDVVRGAVSEIEEYIRVTVERIPQVAISGRAVGDIIHLLAELVENGTSFSPPHTRVVVTGELVPAEDEGGFSLAIGVEDRGLGMSAEALAEANDRLAKPPDFDPANSARLGLLVVGRLAARHGIEVRLRRSAHGGVSAVVVVPEELVTEDVQRAPATPPRQRQAPVEALAAEPTEETAEASADGAQPRSRAVMAGAVAAEGAAQATAVPASDGRPKATAASGGQAALSAAQAVPVTATRARHAGPASDGKAPDASDGQAKAPAASDGEAPAASDGQTKAPAALDGKAPAASDGQAKTPAASDDQAKVSAPVGQVAPVGRAAAAGEPDIAGTPADVAVEVAADLGGLPQRRRGRDGAPLTPQPPAESTPETARTPQRVRATMSAFQSGSANGRSAARQPAQAQAHTEEQGETP